MNVEQEKFVIRKKLQLLQPVDEDMLYWLGGTSLFPQIINQIQKMHLIHSKSNV